MPKEVPSDTSSHSTKLTQEMAGEGHLSERALTDDTRQTHHADQPSEESRYPETSQQPTALPSWLASPERYCPGSDRDRFITRSILSLSSTLAFFRLDDGRAGRLSPSAPVKLAFCVTCILLTSLSRNALFAMVMLAGILARACMLPHKALVRLVRGACAAALLALLITLPAALIGQPQAALFMALKTLTSTGIALTLALTTPPAELTGALRSFGLPSIVILTIDLALRSITRLGETALEVLTALKLRSVGTNRHKSASMAGVGGVVFLKASKLAQDTYDAMRCRGFDGSYHTSRRISWRTTDALWITLGIALVCLFVHLQGAV